MKIGFLGAGTWGFCLASLLCDNGHDVVLWTTDKDLCDMLNKTKTHPKLKGYSAKDNLHVTTDLELILLQPIELLVESVTSSGIRPVFEQVKEIKIPLCPIVITSKGIEQNTGLLLHSVIADVIGEDHMHQIGCLSGPSHAEEVIKNLPTGVVCSGHTKNTIDLIQKAFSSPKFRIYPNTDIAGVAFGGAMKNIIAIACGISDGLGFGDNTKAALMTRGLHEIRKLSVVKGCNPETLNGLAGMGDLCVTCLSTFSRNYRFGNLIAKQYSVEDAKKEIGMVVEGAYSCKSALQLAHKYHVSVPITEAVYRIIYEHLAPIDAVKHLLQRVVKEEHL